MNEPYPCAPLIREIGRGKDGSRALAREPARELMGAMLDGRVSDLELGGVLLALRMKGESVSEVAGFLDAAEARMARVTLPGGGPAVVLPTYNGARHAPNLVPLLAWSVAQAGVPVLMHGQASDPSQPGAGSNISRVPTLEILEALGIPASPDTGSAAQALGDRGLAYLPLAAASPGLARLVSLRRILGVRNVAHTLAKLLRPVRGPSLLLSAYTHPEFGAMLAELFALRREPALLMRGTEGEAVANTRRPQRIARWLDGAQDTAVEGAERAEAQLPGLPPRDAAATADWVRAIQQGRESLPAPIAAQRDAILDTVARMGRAA
ncbi:DNA-binding protein YbiB [Pigmentiphaga sp. NML080357]|uniref:DNA-binding protein YbiB n=1 Tax=Pigmentiphaga sp. NML080357 TaxID=2008675 RepID=UPI000B41D804|nr:DNA-binding protein YbiB [Pigmentiphaga sp. NML080357]OVZ55335.1 DNA-binding protein YbiB [Pigmentiphaga sp. NML080357]